MSSKLASLHAGLVARKGEATPAISNPGFSYVDRPRPMHRPAYEAGYAADHQQARPVSIVERQVAVDRPAVPAMPRPVEHHDDDAHAGPYRLTFRMTHDQRRRIRIAAAQKDQSLQQVLSEALDNHLDGLCACSLRDCACLAREDSEPN